LNTEKAIDTHLQVQTIVRCKELEKESMSLTFLLCCTAVQDTWYALVANAEFMFNNAQNEALPEQLRERRRWFGEQNRELDFFFVSEPAWLDAKFPEKAKQVKRPCVALVSPDKQWMA
jgi:Protein of unknown function (DUF2488)